MTSRNLSRFKLLAFAITLFLPFAGAVFLYQTPGLLSGEKSNYGTLLIPILSIETFDGSSLDKIHPLDIDIFHGKWTFAMVVGETCSLECEANIFRMRQVQTSLGSKRERVQVLLLFHDQVQSPSQDFDNILKRSHNIRPIRIDSSQAPSPLMSIEKERIYIIDPNGNIILRYPKVSTSKGLKKDIKKLLGASHIG